MNGQSAFKWMLIGMLVLLLIPVHLAFISWLSRSADAVDAYGAGVLVGRFLVSNWNGLMVVVLILGCIFLLLRWRPGTRDSD